MEEKYLQQLTDLAQQELARYKLNAQKFGKINTLFIKKILEKEDAHLFIQLPETKKLYLPLITASFVFLYEKNYKEDYTKEFDIEDKIYWRAQKKTYSVIAKDENSYTLKRDHIGTDKYGLSTYKSPETIQPRIKNCKNGYIKVNRDTGRDNFDFLIKFLKDHLNVEEIIATIPYRIAIICSINEFRKEVFNKNSAQHKDIIPYCYITKEGKEENNLPIEPLIYVASDYQTIREHIFDKGKNLEAVIFFDKYSGAKIISKDIRQGQLKRSIFIGEDNLEFKYEKLLTWHWSTEEFCHFYPQDFSPAKITPAYVHSPDLLEAINSFIKDIEEIERQYTVQFSSLKSFARKALFTVYPENNSLLINLLKEKFENESDETLFNELYAVGIEKKDIDKYSKIFQDSFQDILKQIQFENNIKSQELASVNFEYLIVSSGHKENWQQFLKDKKVLTYSEWKRNGDKNKRLLFLGLYGYSHYQTMRNSFDDISILMYANSQEQQLFEYCESKYLFELDNEYHSENRKTLSGLSYPPVDRVSKPEFNKFDVINIDQDNDLGSNNKSYQREEIFLKYSFEDGSSEILPTNRQILIKENESLISEILANIKIGDNVGVYHNFNKDKLENIATSQQKQDILKCKKYAELWKNALVKFYRSKPCCNKDNLLKDLQNKGADISHINTLKKWLDMKDKTLFPSKAKNIMAIKELVNDNALNENIKEISKHRKLYRSIMIALGRDFSDSISRYMVDKEKTDLLKIFDDAKIDKMLKENINFKKVVKISEPNSEEQLEQESLIFQDTNIIETNQDNPISKGEDTVTKEEFEALLQDSEELEKIAKQQADNLDAGIDNLESDIQSKLSSIIAENGLLKEQIEDLKIKLEDAENKIDTLGSMQSKHHAAIRQLIKSFNNLNTKIYSLISTLK